MNRKLFPNTAVLALLALVALATAPPYAQNFQDIYDLNCGSMVLGGCGAIDNGQLTQGIDGNLYGTASAGGTFGGGTIFMATPSAAST